ncbi:PQQ-binding-like beta-propeller repeat protein, partial [Planctomycetota bacterium]
TQRTVYFQSDNADEVAQMRAAADQIGLLGARMFIDAGKLKSIYVGDNVADAVVVSNGATEEVEQTELLRILRPKGRAYVAGKTITKPVPDGIDEWTHPYHGPDNNPQSTDQLARGKLITQFLGYPKFSPMPEQTVVAGGRIFKAMGHIAHKKNQNEWLNTLLCINAYNGTILWKRSIPEGFMLHRNTMVASEDALYMGDHESCKIIDAATGKTIDEIKVSGDISDGPVWKWMAIRGGVLYGLVGNPEIQVDTQKSARRGLGHWPWGMWKGHDYKDPRTAFGYGRTLVAIDLKTKKTIWHYRDEEFLDARAVCMNANSILVYSPEIFLAAVDTHKGTLQWKNDSKELLEAIGPNGKAQHYVTGYSTTCYMKCNNEQVFFAGPQRSQLVAASARNGDLNWTFPEGNLQLVLRPESIWAAGAQKSKSGVRIAYDGNVLSEFVARRACTRATGSVDSVFYRANGGTVRVFSASYMTQHIDPMRPPCQDGVIVSNGNMYWGPWMCGCQLSLYGNICLTPARTQLPTHTEPPLSVSDDEPVKPFTIHPSDWTTYRGDNSRGGRTNVPIPDQVEMKWISDVSTTELPTAPVAAGGLVFVADRAGVVRAMSSEGEEVWKSYVGGAVFYAPAVAHDRVYVGSADGRVYAFEAATGRQLWSYRVGPQVARIPVYEKLVSRWPVSCGVVVQDQTVYAAAGIAHYDGTFVVALDALSGELKAANDNSGTVAEDVNNGMSLQGNLRIVDNELRFLAGGVYETARYDLKTLECLNSPKNSQVHSEFRTAFYSYYPEYGKYVSIDYTFENGCNLVQDASYEGNQFSELALHEALPPGVDKPRKEAARWIQRRGGTAPEVLWRDQNRRRSTSYIVSKNHLVLGCHPDGVPNKPSLVLLDIEDGSKIWEQTLPALPVKGGTAIDHKGRIFVSLENGKLCCFESGK